MNQLTSHDVFTRLRPRLPDSNKGNYGAALLCCGSAAYRGAARLSAEGALRIGAGLVTLASLEKVLLTVLPALPECICLPMAESERGTLCAQNSTTLAAAMQHACALLFGCGLGQDEDTAALLETVLASSTPLVLDADGLNLLAKQPTPFSFTGRSTILTPHPGEMARLCGCRLDDILAQPARAAVHLAQKLDCVLVLKLHRTLIALPNGILWQNTTGNAGLARGGSGDFLAGMIAGLLAQGYSAEDAALCGVYLHGAAADAASAVRGMQTMLPSDLS
ncbi:MAG: NAD(P)H-hydrate dehydratase, partial [Pygmaiobacter sp.]